MPSLEPENERAVITREQQSDLDPILGEAMVLGLGLADLVMAAYLLGREHEAAVGTA